MGDVIYGRPLARCNFPPVIRMGQRKIAKNLKSPKIYILQHFFVCVLYKRIIPTEFDTRLEKNRIFTVKLQKYHEIYYETNSKITQGKMQKTYYAI